MFSVSPAERDQKFEDITALMKIMMKSMEQIPGYEYGLISFGVDRKVGTVGHCSHKQIIGILDSLLSELEPEDAINYVLSRVRVLKDAIIEVIKERGMPNED